MVSVRHSKLTTTYMFTSFIYPFNSVIDRFWVSSVSLSKRVYVFVIVISYNFNTDEKWNSHVNSPWNRGWTELENGLFGNCWIENLNELLDDVITSLSNWPPCWSAILDLLTLGWKMAYNLASKRIEAAI